ncbi:hypothetical protein [Gloeocapsopsis dulcis]|uniref:Uncharacterized protein n=1 Tax=Gloeocapsopsis dulcis AAB1 = 1H9 TaxID=1433147 RepID=A0A6N8G3C7_9CHRO|nr:hypothetical protein [Gloeocapsopsis dulcis]MUL39312.1 hypothetical protein [Gloeocapsopsis dulcis AAB1 = 1H9]WNN91558.1 hypothetical protein P0S91_10990 [Gloeocapsopsis dulcis]
MPSPFDATEVKSDNCVAALLETSMMLQNYELSVPEETRPNNITVTFDSEAGSATIAATIPVTITLDPTGKPVITAEDYIP